jgi:uncharacterized Ntn-hydrolase superfamily protein
MTFSIAARSADGAFLGVAVASRVIAVGRAVPAAAVGAGAVATQALCNMTYRPRGIELLRAGHSAAEVVAMLLDRDDDREHRQVGVVDHLGTSATHTGSRCLPWAGGVSGPGYAIQGNILAGEHVVLAMERAWLATDDADPLGRRLGAALLAGDRAGGDRRGRQSAGILVVTRDGAHEANRGSDHYEVNDEHTNLRVDDHTDPVFELMRLINLRDVSLSVRGDGETVELVGSTLAEVGVLLQRVGYAPDGDDAAAAQTAVRRWAFSEDLDERLDADNLPVNHMDSVVLRYLRYRAGVGMTFDTNVEHADVS